MENSDRFWNIVDNANSFSARSNSDKVEFGWARQVNLAFGVELYLKAIMEFEKQEIKKGHNLKTLFNFLDNKTRDVIYNNWRTFAGTNIPNSKKIRDWFNDNIFACCNTFGKFRYVNEWAGCRTSLETSWSNDQWNQLSIFSVEHEYGRLPVYGSFLKEFENAIKKHITDNIVSKLPRQSHDLDMAAEISCTIIRADGSTKTEKEKVNVSMNIIGRDE